MSYPDPKDFRKRDPVLTAMRGDFPRVSDVVVKNKITFYGMRGRETYVDPPTVRRYVPHEGGVVSGARLGGS